METGVQKIRHACLQPIVGQVEEFFKNSPGVGDRRSNKILPTFAKYEYIWSLQTGTDGILDLLIDLIPGAPYWAFSMKRRLEGFKSTNDSHWIYRTIGFQM